MWTGVRKTEPSHVTFYEEGRSMGRQNQGFGEGVGGLRRSFPKSKASKGLQWAQPADWILESLWTTVLPCLHIHLSVWTKYGESHTVYVLTTYGQRRERADNLSPDVQGAGMNSRAHLIKGATGSPSPFLDPTQRIWLDFKLVPVMGGRVSRSLWIQVCSACGRNINNTNGRL